MFRVPRTVKVQQAGQDIHRGHAGPFVGVAGAGGNESNQRAELPQLQRDLRDRASQGSHLLSTHAHSVLPRASVVGSWSG